MEMGCWDPEVTVFDEQALVRKRGKKVVEIPPSPPSTQLVPLALAQELRLPSLPTIFGIRVLTCSSYSYEQLFVG